MTTRMLFICTTVNWFRFSLPSIGVYIYIYILQTACKISCTLAASHMEIPKRSRWYLYWMNSMICHGLISFFKESNSAGWEVPRTQLVPDGLVICQGQLIWHHSAGFSFSSPKKGASFNDIRPVDYELILRHETKWTFRLHLKLNIESLINH